MKFPKKLLVVFILLLASLTIVACKKDPVEPENAKPSISGTGAVAIVLYDEFDPLAGVKATDAEDGDLTSKVTVKTNTVNNEVVGSYTVVYEVKDSKGLTATATRSVTVNDRALEDYPLAQYLSGVDLSKLPASEKDILFAAAERYLLENVYGGVPLYTGASRVMYADRVQLFSETYNGVMGFGIAFSQFTKDDSNVLMYGSTYGKADEYTWRASYSTDPTSLNPWNADDSATSDFIDLFKGGLYNFFFDASKTGYEILPELAASLPQAVGGQTINGKQYAKKWTITLRDDLVWKFHPGFDTSVLPAGFDKLDANDYVWTWKYALDNDWFRARTGGGDFVSQGIKNAAEYLNDSVAWSEVGIKLLDNNTIELEYVTEKAAFDVLYGFAGGVMTPINQQLFEKLGDQYGVNPVNVASSGVYYFDVWTPGQLLTFKRNELHPDAAMYNYTGRQYTYIDDSAQIFAEFLAGRLESASVPSAELKNYASDPRVKVAPDPTTWRLQINAFGTEANRDAYIENTPGNQIDETFVPEPILMYKSMRQALMYGFDRYEAAVNVVGTYLPAFTLFTSTYFLDGESGLSVRGGEAGQAIVDDFGGSSYGYFPDVAKTLFKEAVAQGIADGYYVKGTASKYTEIELILSWGSSGNTSAQAMVANLVEQYEALLVDSENFVKVKFTVNDIAFPNQYYDYMMPANTDLGIGGISGSLLDAPSFLDVFSDDNRGGFTLNWGIDTTSALIPVAYTNLDGDFVYEKWGFNALITALVGNVYVKDGLEQVAWDNADDLIEAYLDMNGEALESSSDGASLAEYVLGDTLANIATEEGFDSVVAKIVVTESGKNFLYVISVENNAYKLYQSLGLSTSADDAIHGYLSSNYGYSLDEATLITTDAELLANAYMAANYPLLTTLAEVATKYGAPAQYMELYGLSRKSGSGVLGVDAIIVLHIGEYYLVWEWL